MSQKMQQLLDLLVNEEMDKANELFHEIVVEKSRDIYENLIAEESDDDLEEEEMDEAADDADESVEEGFGDEPEADPADKFAADVEAPTAHDEFGSDDMGDEEDMGGDGSAPATRDDVQDLEDALAELKAEFEALVGGSGASDEEEMGDEEGEDDGEENPFGDEEGEAGDEEEADDEFEESMGVVREYRETVKAPNNQEGASNTKSVGLQNPKGRPTTTASAHNILGGKGGEAGIKGGEGLVGGIKGEFTKGVEKNISSSAKSGMKDGAALSKNPAGHGAEKKGSGEGQANTRSVTDRRQ